MKKRVWTLFMALVVCVAMLSIGAVSVSAAPSATVTVATVSGKVGDIVEVPVTISANSYLVNADMLIQFDPTKLALDTTYYADPDDDENSLCYRVNTELFPNSWMYGGNEAAPGEFKFLPATGGHNGMTKGGEMFRMAFRILAGEGETVPITFSAEPIRGNDGTGEPNDAGYPEDESIALTVVNGGVTVESDVKLGDVNGDGQIDMRDAFAVYRAASGSGASDEVAAYGDMNGDGQIDMRDAFAVYRIASGAV